MGKAPECVAKQKQYPPPPQLEYRYMYGHQSSFMTAGM